MCENINILHFLEFQSNEDLLNTVGQKSSFTLSNTCNSKEIRHN